jgi:hypothetical protein
MTGTTAAPRRYYQRDWVLACRDATSFYSTPLAWDLSGPLDPQLVAGALAGSVEVSVPLLREGTDVDLPALPAVPDEPGNDLRVSRNPDSGEVEVLVTGRVPEQVSAGGHRYRLAGELRARVRPDAPGAAGSPRTQVGEVLLAGGDVVTVRCTQTAVRAGAEVCTNGSVVFARTWETVLVPACPVIGCR